MTGKKYDNGKPDLSLIPLSALEEEARGFMLGEKKYGRYNYTNGLESHRLIAAALRHIHAWNEGESTDPESGASHLGHARCCLAMLLECGRLGTLVDTRRTTVEFEKQVDAVIEEMNQNRVLEVRDTFRNQIDTTIHDLNTKGDIHEIRTESSRLPDGSSIEWYVGHVNVLDYIK